MNDARLAKTANRSVVGIMNDLTRLAEVYQANNPAPDLLGLAVRLAATPCSPLYKKRGSPDRELRARMSATAAPTA